MEDWAAGRVEVLTFMLSFVKAFFSTLFTASFADILSQTWHCVLGGDGGVLRFDFWFENVCMSVGW
jgi:hypothetical protein